MNPPSSSPSISPHRRSTNPYPILPSRTELDTATILGISDVAISAVPSESYKIATSSLKEGAVCINIAMKSNFEGDVRDRARVFAERVGAVTILMLQLNCLLLRQQREQ
jgi:methylenetetrahydrofolate dehydrogenase (NAD+)